MQSSEVGSFLEFGEVRIHGATSESSKEGNESLGQSVHEVSVLLVQEVSASRWGGSVEVLGKGIRHTNTHFNSIDDRVHKLFIGNVEGF